MHRCFNSIFFSITIKISNEACYDFTLFINTDLIYFNTNRFNKIFTKQTIQNSKAFFRTFFKLYYDRKHNNCHFQVNDWALFRLHKEYNIFAIIALNKKLSQQYVESFKILKKVKNLVYQLQISKHWKTHLVISVAQLKSFSSFFIN